MDPNGRARVSAEEIWDRIVAEDRDRWIAGVPAFRERLMQDLVRFGDRPLCNHLRPKFLTTSEMAALTRSSEAVMAGIIAAGQRIMDDRELRGLMGFSPIEEEMIAPDPGFAHPAPCVRLDSFITPEGPRFVELNGECPAGPGYSDRLAEAFLDHEISARFRVESSLKKIDTIEPLLDTLLACWNEFGGAADPHVAIVDYDDVSTRFEFEICRHYFESRGVRTSIVDPRALEYRDGRLRGPSGEIDLVYKRVLMNEFIDRLDEVRPLFEAYRDGAVCVVNPFRAKLVHKKAIFAVLTADDRADWMDAALIPEIDRAVPWTRVLVPGRTRFENEEGDLRDLLIARQKEFVLKPNDDYGGKGITLGWEVDAAQWSAALDAAMGRDFVAQQRVAMISEAFPAFSEDLHAQQLFVDLDPFLYLGRVGGVLARLGVGSLCNVTSGGGQVPVMVVPDEVSS
jgi:uncharacterized circularly permuted ATP-grasp superfamily protein